MFWRLLLFVPLHKTDNFPPRGFLINKIRRFDNNTIPYYQIMVKVGTVFRRCQIKLCKDLFAVMETLRQSSPTFVIGDPSFPIPNFVREGERKARWIPANCRRE